MDFNFKDRRQGSLIIENADDAAHNRDLLDRLHGKLKDTEYYVLLDRQRNEQDRFRRRGYDYDHSHPDHFDYLMRNGKYCACQTKKGRINAKPTQN